MRRAYRKIAGMVLFISLMVVGMGPSVAGEAWTQFRGPNRDDISTETGLLKKWPVGGPRRLWTARGIGHGFATVSISGGLIYTAGNVGNDSVITALGPDGQIKWQAKNGRAYTRDHPGYRSTPTVEEDKVWSMNPDGDMICLDAKTGKEVWSLNILREFNGRNIGWALAESPLIDGDNLICSPGGKNAGIVALNKKTGKTVWICRNTRDKPSYASPIVFDYEGLRQIVTMTAKAAVGLNAKTGKLLWRFEHKTAYDANIPTPIFHDGYLFIDSGYGAGGSLLKLDVKGNSVGVSQVWRDKALDNHHGGVVLVDGYLYGASQKGRWICLDFKTGKEMYKERGIRKGSLTYADGMLYCLNEKGTVGLAKATPVAHRVVSQFNIPRGGKGPTWAHPVVCNGRLYIRHSDYLFAFDIKA